MRSLRGDEIFPLQLDYKALEYLGSHIVQFVPGFIYICNASWSIERTISGER